MEVVNQYSFGIDPRLILILEPHKILILTLEPENITKDIFFWEFVETCSKIYKDKMHQNAVLEEIPIAWGSFR